MQNLEKEYKSHHDEPMPDLWNRIEAGLTDATKRRAKAERKKKIMKYMPMAAAVLVCIAVIPGAIKMTEDSAMTESCAPDMAAPEESYNGAAMDEDFLVDMDSFPVTGESTLETECDTDYIKDTQYESAIRVECIEGRFTVIGMTAEEGADICTLSDSTGKTLKALCPADVELTEGKEYEMVLIISPEEKWDYKIEKADSR